ERGACRRTASFIGTIDEVNARPAPKPDRPAVPAVAPHAIFRHARWARTSVRHLPFRQSAIATMLKLYSYFRSSAAYRVRIALNLKGLSYEILPVHLTKAGGEQRRPEYRSINPQMRVPALVVSGGEVLTQSLAIIDYLEETRKEPPLLPGDPVRRANIRAIAQTIACDIHPLDNLVVLQYLKRTLEHDQATIDSWYVHWI